MLIHDLRSPLIAAAGMVDRLREEGDTLTFGERQGLLEHVAKALDGLRCTLVRIYDLDRSQAGAITVERTATDGAAVIRRVLDQLDTGGHVIVEDPSPCVLETDVGLLERALHNVVDNALNHTPIGSTIWVVCRGTADGALFIVEDDGPGVPEQMRRRIFAPFDRGMASASTSGLGLGLALVDHITRFLGGRVWVEEQKGGGASFHLLFPTGCLVDGSGVPLSGYESRRPAEA